MNDLRFREIHIDSEPEIAQAFIALVEAELGGVRQLTTIKRALDYDAGNAKIIGGFLGDTLVSINAFMKMEFFLGERTLIGYQSGFSATSRLHRGKGLWVNLLKFSEEYLASLGASFVFGFPNPISHPIFTTKLGYQSSELYSFRVPCLPILERYSYNSISAADSIAHSEMILEPNPAFNIAWKKRALNGESLASFTLGESVIWGVVRKKQKYRLKFNYFEVGGLSLTSARDLPRLLHIATRAVNARYYDISLNRSNVYFPILRYRDNHHAPVIIKPLTKSLSPERLKLNFFKGLSDVF